LLTFTKLSTNLHKYKILQKDSRGVYCGLIAWRNIQTGDPEQKLHFAGGVPDSLIKIKVLKRGLITTVMDWEAALDSIL